VGRHSVAEEPPPPENKPGYRFPLAIGAIVLLACASMAIVAAVFPERTPRAAATTPENPAAGNPFPQLPGEPTITSEPASTGPSAAVSGTFQLSRDYDGGFIGAVQLFNGATSAESWQVKLVFPSNVGTLQAHWISGGPGDTTVAQAGQTFTFTSQQPLAAGAKIGLSFQFGKTAGDPHPRECSVNGTPCSVG
jgi:hypothetical protein